MNSVTQKSNSILTATAPEKNVIVKASAGVGKTYLLVSRILRLLIAGIRPDSILAITFTRKAATEIQARLNARLFTLCTCSDEELDKHLDALGETPTAALKQRVRHLYETFMHTEPGIRASTFHAFCQDLLRRFPLEADVPAGFALLERTGALFEQAWDALYAEASFAPDSELAKSLEQLYDHTRSIHSVKTTLQSFFEHRADWWAFVQDQREPITYAAHQLRAKLDIDPSVNPYEQSINDAFVQATMEFALLLRKHYTATNEKDAAKIDEAYPFREQPQQWLSVIRGAFLTQKGEPKKRSESNAQKKSLGADGEARFLLLHDQCSEKIRSIQALAAKHDTYHRCHAWYIAGVRLIDHYQRIKTEQRLLDFSDLEWRAFYLLTQSDNAVWVQYKLDQRIDHLLIDEFQDTNPTQWRLILPILEEFATQPERPRSAFIVGDKKQSIFGFRRADSNLIDTAGHWIATHLQAMDYSMDQSRRSSPAIMELVNRVFGSDALAGLLPDFQPHGTVHHSLPGKVSLLPLQILDDDESNVETTEFRNPLINPRPNKGESARFKLEGDLIANRITQLVGNIAIGEKNNPLRFRDVMLLVRTRTHLPFFERSLREAKIPYISASRGTLLKSQEILDLIALLEFLTSPQHDLNLARVLRSPIFSCSNEHLIDISRAKGKYWFDKLENTCRPLTIENTLTRSYSLLSRWRKLAGILPVHDLLDRIYHEANLVARYEANYPPHLRLQAKLHLQEFLAFALEVDSGRYPSIGRFLSQLAEIRIHDNDSAGENNSNPQFDAVQVLTIHASKGLEASIVFLADTANEPNNKNAHRALVEWPSDLDRPSDFLLLSAKSDLDEYSLQLIERQQQKARQEEMNLLYVALTRAKQQLYISGAAKQNASKLGWYGHIRDAWPEFVEQDFEFGEFSAPKSVETPRPVEKPIETMLANPIPSSSNAATLKPSEDVDSEYDGAQAKKRGKIIHRLLQLLTESVEPNQAMRQVAFEQNVSPDAQELRDALQEVSLVLSHTPFATWFDQNNYQTAHNELPIYYQIENRTVNGVIDRIVINDNSLTLIDYKTHRTKDPKTLEKLAEDYKTQLHWYREGVQRIWPEKHIQSVLIFTYACQYFIDSEKHL